jgi:hypothetical protein
MAIDRLIPSVAGRLSAWISVQERLREQPPRSPRPTLTITRQFGCEAYPLAERLKETLDARTGDTWTIFDKTLIEQVSRETHLSEQLFANLGDASRVLDALASTIPGWRTHAERYELLARQIVRIAQDGNAIIVGRGASVLTQAMPNCFHFRLEATHEHRVASIQRRLALDQQAADALVREHEQRRERFLDEMLHCSIADTRYYHAVYDTTRSPIERVGASICALLPFLG